MKRKTGLFSVDAFIMRLSLRFLLGHHSDFRESTATLGRYDIGNDLQCRPHNAHGG
jgi:hypothetical protein